MKYLNKEILDGYKEYLKSNNGVSLSYYIKHERNINGDLKVTHEVIQDIEYFELLMKGLVLTKPGTLYIITEFDEVYNLIPKEDANGNISVFSKQIIGKPKEFRVNVDAESVKILS